MSSRWKKHNLRCYDNNYAHAWGGFTLLEIAFITAVLAVLFTMAVATFNRVQSGSRDNKRDLDMHILYSELEKYYESHGEYPAGCPDTDSSVLAGQCWLLSTNAMAAPSLDSSTSLSSLQTILPGIGDDWGDPRFPVNSDGSPVASPGDIKPFMLRDTSNDDGRYFYLGSSSTGDVSTSRPSYFSLHCTFLLPASSIIPSNYMAGYFSEVDTKWHLFHGLHGEKWQIENCTEGVEYIIDTTI